MVSSPWWKRAKPSPNDPITNMQFQQSDNFSERVWLDWAWINHSIETPVSGMGRFNWKVRGWAMRKRIEASGFYWLSSWHHPRQLSITHHSERDSVQTARSVRPADRIFPLIIPQFHVSSSETRNRRRDNSWKTIFQPPITQRRSLVNFLKKDYDASKNLVTHWILEACPRVRQPTGRRYLGEVLNFKLVAQCAGNNLPTSSDSSETSTLSLQLGRIISTFESFNPSKSSESLQESLERNQESLDP